MQIGDSYKELKQTKFAGSVTPVCAESIMLEQAISIEALQIGDCPGFA